MTPAAGTAENPLRVAIIGSGPAGFYAAGQLLGHDDPVVLVDVFDRLPTPWGLVRAGVAPDHPKIKSVTRVFERTAAKPGFRFHGNVEVGTDVTHEELMDAYHAVIYAVGTAADRRLGIPGEDLLGSHAATEFVAWYNGHPDYAELEFDLSCQRAVVIGNGNVALDVARMLALSVDELAVTDIADHALEALRNSQIEEIVVLGRRGPAQAAFTNPELRELADLELADVIVDPADMELDEPSAAALETSDGTTKRNVETLRQYAGTPSAGRPRRIVLKFLSSPIAIDGEDRVESVTIERNQLIAGDDGALRARPTGQREHLTTGLVLRSIGYVGTPLPGVPFDGQRSTVLNQDGRVIDPDTREPLTGVYAAGWIKRGPSGVIGTNKKCAQETTDLLQADYAAGRLAEPTASADELLATLHERTHVVDYSGWEAIDAHERSLGEPAGRPRVKLVARPEMLERSRPLSPSGSQRQ
ncbi:MAG TPA: FAD-dependent oxidoreductase [Solirubrobacteraceae bacterium]|jgi:ferredoxin--NADP+ reductase|nr:FAD-dependent oxidoreductase [Solirubrobacteraceae bacterium]